MSTITRPARTTAPLLLAILGAAHFPAALSLAGTLTPPAGPVAPTMKPLSQIEPRIAINATNTPGDNDATPSLFKITQPGSYYLTDNITITDNRSAIEIVASDVTIDLSGFRVANTGTAPNGISYTVPALSAITVRNGTITGFVSTGVSLDFCKLTTLQDVTVRLCGVGARLGNDARVRDCTFANNTLTGLIVQLGGTVENSIAAENGLGGFVGQSRTIFRGCSARDNGERGFSVLSAAVITDCSASGNDQNGFWLQSGGHVSNSQASFNSAVGIFLNGTGTAVNNTVVFNSHGIIASNGANRIDSNHVANNTNNGIQVLAGGNSLVVRNSARGNGTNYNIPAGESAQVITDPGVNFVATNPWANFAY